MTRVQCIGNHFWQLSGMAASGHFQTKLETGSSAGYWSGPPTSADVLHPAFVLNSALDSPARFQRQRRLPVGKRFPTEVLGKGLRIFWLAKQNTTKSLSSRRREYVSGDTCTAALSALLAPHAVRSLPTYLRAIDRVTPRRLKRDATVCTGASLHAGGESLPREFAVATLKPSRSLPSRRARRRCQAATAWQQFCRWSMSSASLVRVFLSCRQCRHAAACVQ
jgi:hypothetical protein